MTPHEQTAVLRSVTRSVRAAANGARQHPILGLSTLDYMRGLFDGLAISGKRDGDADLIRVGYENEIRFLSGKYQEQE